MLAKISRFLKNSKGATAIEYALIASLIAVVAISGMKLIGNKILEKLNTIANSLDESTT
ncbi:MAG: Flp family type IVb pilin [Holosporaceae bacterium]|jgi:pilus assembly protein Flp/PilA|nr:Flp family type IVb pilin [Holosporaceae bacterium]